MFVSVHAVAGAGLLTIDEKQLVMRAHAHQVQTCFA